MCEKEKVFVPTAEALKEHLNIMNRAAIEIYCNPTYVTEYARIISIALSDKVDHIKTVGSASGIRMAFKDKAGKNKGFKPHRYKLTLEVSDD